MRDKFIKLISFFLLFIICSAPAFSFCKKQKIERNKKNVCASVTDYRFSAANMDWWENFNDPYMKEYIYKTLTNNHDLKYAALKTREYYENVKSVRSGELPKLDLSPAYVHVRTPGFDFNGIILDPTSSNIFAVPLIASYEADIFLKNHDKTKSAKKEYESVFYQEKAAYISLASSCATAYLNIVKLDKLIQIQESVVKVRKEIFELTQDRYKAGLASTFDTTATDKQHTIALIELNDLKKQRAVLLHQLAVLTGENPSCVENLKRSSLEEIEYNGKIPSSISSQIVVNRPDLMEIEAKLQKAKIDIRVARKDFLPTIPVTGIIGFNNVKLERLFDWDSFLALIAVNMTQNLYTGGRKMAALKMRKIQYQELFENYKQADLQAIKEINDSLCQIKYDTRKDKDNIRKYSLEHSNYKIIDMRYKAGITSHFDKIQFQENLLTLQKDLTNSKTQRLIDYLSLYKSVGGAL